MDGYKILIVEDKLEENISTYWKLFERWDTSPEGEKDESIKVDSFVVPGGDNLLGDPDFEGPRGRFDQFKSLGFVDVAENTMEALERLKSNADDYLVILVDRDLGDWDPKKTEENQEVLSHWQKVWPEVPTNPEFGGDVLLEYLCLKKGMIEECRKRFRFFTHNEKDSGGINDLLTALRFPDDLKKKMIVPKDRGSEDPTFVALKELIENQPTFFIQNKYSDVFQVLGASAEDFKISADEHVQNLIKALAYVEGIKLDGRTMEKPSINFLRALLEAFRSTLRSERLRTQVEDYFAIPLRVLRGRIPEYDFSQADISKWFDPYANTRNSPEGKFKQTHSHYANIDRMIYAITSQEIHNNKRGWLDGYRLQMVVYGLCELLLFYHEKLKGPTIEYSEGDLHKSKILNLLHYLNHDADNWVSIGTLTQFSQFLTGIHPGGGNVDADDLERLGFKINPDRKKFKTTNL